MKATRTLFAVIMSMVFMSASAYDFEVDGICYDINPDGKTVSVTYNGTYHVSSSKIGGVDNNKYSGKVNIPEMISHETKIYKVSTIGALAFYYCKDLVSVELPNTIESIGDRAFCICGNLHNVYYNGDLDDWLEIDFNSSDSNPLCNGANLFLNGMEQEELVIPNTVNVIKDFAFCGGYFQSVNIPKSLKTIGKEAFKDCKSLSSVHISDLRAWCVTDFYNEGKSSSYYPEVYSNPLYYARNLYLNGNKIVDLVIPNDIDSIKQCAFLNCNLLSVTIPKNLVSIGDFAFFYCDSMSTVSIADGIKSIGNNAFYGCSSLSSVHISDLKAWCKIDFSIALGEDSRSNPLYYARNLYLNGKKIVDLVIPDNIDAIKPYAFIRCNITSVTVPKNIASIGNYAFYLCDSLSSVKFADGIKKIGKWAFAYCGLTSIDIPNSVERIDEDGFLYCTKLRKATIGSKEIGYSAFRFSGLEDIVFKEGVSIIGEEAFIYSYDLSSITFPSSLSSIQFMAFNCCERI